MIHPVRFFKYIVKVITKTCPNLVRVPTSSCNRFMAEEEDQKCPRTCSNGTACQNFVGRRTNDRDESGRTTSCPYTRSCFGVWLMLMAGPRTPGKAGRPCLRPKQVRIQVRKLGGSLRSPPGCYGRATTTTPSSKVLARPVQPSTAQKRTWGRSVVGLLDDVQGRTFRAPTGRAESISSRSPPFKLIRVTEGLVDTTQKQAEQTMTKGPRYGRPPGRGRGCFFEVFW
jgi:hypothetical protein